MHELMLSVLNVMWIAFLAICYIIFRDLRGGYLENNQLKSQGLSKIETVEVLTVMGIGIVVNLFIPFDKVTLVLLMLAGLVYTIVISQIRFSKKYPRLTSALGFLLVLALTLGTVLGLQKVDLTKFNPSETKTEMVELLPEEIQSHPNLDYTLINAIVQKSKLLPKSFELVKVNEGEIVAVLMDGGVYTDTLNEDVYGFRLSGNVFLKNCQLSGTNLTYESLRFTTKLFEEEWVAYKLLPYLKLYKIQISSTHIKKKSQPDGYKRLNYLIKKWGRTCFVKIESPVKQLATSEKDHIFLVDTTGLMIPKKEKEGFKGYPVFK